MFIVQRVDTEDIELICRVESEFWADKIRDLLDAMDDDYYYVVAKEDSIWTKKLLCNDEEE